MTTAAKEGTHCAAGRDTGLILHRMRVGPSTRRVRRYRPINHLPLASHMQSVFLEGNHMPQQQEFADLLETNLLALNRFVLGMVGNPFDAADIVQETAAKAFIHFADFRAQAKFKTWLMSIALNEVRGRRRREARSRLFYFEVEQLEQLPKATACDSPFRQYQEKEAGRILDDALSSLDPSNQDVLRLRAFDGRDMVDTARQLSISVSAAKARYFRAVRHLSRELVRRTRRPLRAKRPSLLAGWAP